MGGWMETARANARAMDQAAKQNPYKERLRQAGEYARKNGLAPQSVQTASSAIKPTEIKIADPMSGLRSRESSQYLLSDDLKSAGEQMKSDVNAKLVTDGAFANAAVKNLRANGQTEAADNLKSQLDALERERHIAELRENQAAQSSQKIPAPKPVLPQYSNSYFASPGVKEIGENIITRYNAQAMLDYMGSREYAHKQETARKRAQAEADAIYKEMKEYIANPNVNALVDPKILDYRNRYHAALMESVPNETQEWETEQYLDILAAGGESLMNVVRNLAEERERTYSRKPTISAGFDEANAYFNRYNQLKKKYGDALDDWLTYADHVRNGEIAEGKLADWQQFGRDKSDFATWNTSVVAGLGSYAGYIDAWGQKLTNAITGKDYPIDYNTPAQMPAKISQAIRNGATEDKTGFGRFLYNSTASIADSTIPLAFGGPGKAILALSGATNYMQAAAERGVPDNQALFIGGVCGVADMAIEKLGFDRIFGTKSAGTLADDIIGIFNNAGLEALGEGATTLITTAADALIAGDKSEINTEINHYMEQGYSYNEAVNLARKSWVSGLALDMAGGYFSGGVLSSGKVGFNAATGKYNTNKPVAAPQQSVQPTFVGKLGEQIKNWNDWDKLKSGAWNAVNGLQWLSPYGQIQPALADGWTNAPVEVKGSSLLSRPVMYFVDKKHGSSYNQNEKSLEPQTGREWHAFNRSYANKTSDIKKGEERRIIINTADYVYLVCADGYMHGYIADKICILGNEKKLHKIREEFTNGRTDKRGETSDSNVEAVQDGYRRSHWDLPAAKREKRTVGIDLLDEDASRSDSIGDYWESYGDIGSEEELEASGVGTMFFDGENAYERTEAGWIRIPLGEDAPILSDEDKSLIERKRSADDLWEAYRIIADEEELRAIEEMKNMYYGEK